MAYLLRGIPLTTIRQRLTAFFAVTISIAVFLNVFTIGVHVMVAQTYDKGMEQLLNLNQFYFHLDELNGYVRSYTQGGDSAQKEAMERCRKNMNFFLDELTARKEDMVFQRDITDVKGLIQTYEESMEEIYTSMEKAVKEKMEPAIASKISEEYEKMQLIYEIIRNEFKTLEMEMMEDIRQEREMVDSRETFYYIELFAGLILLVAAGMVYARKISHKIHIPIEALTKASEDILSGKRIRFQKVDIKEELDTEMKLLVDAFNTMTERIEKQVRQIEENASAKVALREKELENLQITNLLKTSELKALQMQMNPHFLFNTLNMIAKTAYIEEADKTVFLLQKTAQLLRYSLDYMGKSVTLAREIEMLGNYVYLQEQRFGERIAFEFKLDERFHQMQIPCLILQPLVENAISHGVGAYLQSGKINIQTYYNEKEKTGEIAIEDNGYGMTEQQLEQLREDLESPARQREKIGLANVYMRLKLFYGGKAKFEIESIPKVKTAIRIRIPYPPQETEKKREERGVQEECTGF